MARKQQGIQSVEVGMRVLKALVATPQDMSLKSVSAATGMTASTTHRYLVSLIRAGLVAQDVVTGFYGLGAEALEVGLAALGRIDPVQIGTAAQAELHRHVDVTSLLAIWGTHGPTVIRWREASQPVTVNVRVGSVMPVLTSATGRGFLTWRKNDALIAKLVAKESAGRHKSGLPAIDVDQIRAEALSRGMARVDGDLLPGISGLAVPIVAHDGNAILVLTALGFRGIFDVSWDGPIATALKDVATTANRRIGPPVIKYN